MVAEQLVPWGGVSRQGVPAGSYLVSLHAVLLRAARHGGGDPVPALGRGDGEGLQGLLQELLLISGPGHRVSSPWEQQSIVRDSTDSQGSLKSGPGS